MEALAALLWWEALQGAALALLQGAVLHPGGTTVLKAELPGTSGLGQSGQASVPDPLCLLLETPREGCWVESLWGAPMLSSGPSGASRAESLSSPFPLRRLRQS